MYGFFQDLFSSKAKKTLLNMNFILSGKNKIEIENYVFPDVVIKRTKEELGINDELFELVELSLKDFFFAIKQNKEMEMIDKAADILWHNFLLDTKSYMKFCSEYFGFYLHHIPYMEEKKFNNDNIFELIYKYKNSFLETKYNDYRNKKINKFLNSILSNVFEPKEKIIQLNYIDKLSIKKDDEQYFFTSILLQQKYTLSCDHLILKLEDKVVLNDKILSQKEFRNLKNNIEKEDIKKYDNSIIEDINEIEANSVIYSIKKQEEAKLKEDFYQQRKRLESEDDDKRNYEHKKTRRERESNNSSSSAVGGCGGGTSNCGGTSSGCGGGCGGGA